MGKESFTTNWEAYVVRSVDISGRFEDHGRFATEQEAINKSLEVIKGEGTQYVFYDTHKRVTIYG